MTFVGAYSHLGGNEAWAEREKYEWLTDIFSAPRVLVQAGTTTDIRRHLTDELEKEGWAFNVRVDVESDLTVYARKDDLAVQIQTGNISRYAYDVIKLQHLYLRNEIAAAALIVPTKEAAQKLGSNIANADRILNELRILKHVITVPIMILAFE